ncbi:aspartate-alanine antiporter [Pseudochelatococcus sp. G4_1912]|uniref:aspartate-alanine antiporter n=1 Tax=Pseudochelatococcus sp. G4_1912 TaxID=3114288 RepID=UPI0039C69FA0
MFIWDWFVTTLRENPEIALFLAVAIGYPLGILQFKSFSLGTVTTTLLVGILIGQLDIPIARDIANVFFLLFLFAVGYSVGPQFVRGIARDGIPQALFATVVSLLFLSTAWLVTRIAGYNIGYGAGLFAGGATISSALGLATNAIGRLNLSANEIHGLVAAVSTAFAMTYIYGTVGSTLIVGQLGRRLLGIDLPVACKQYAIKMGGVDDDRGTFWHHYIIRAYELSKVAPQVGKTVAEVEASIPHLRVFIDRIRRNGQIINADETTVLQEGDIIGAAGARGALHNLFAIGVEEKDDADLLDVPDQGMDVLVTKRAFDGKTLGELAHLDITRGIFLNRIRRGATGSEIPILAQTVLHRGDVLTVSGRPQRIREALDAVGRADFSTKQTDITFLFIAIVLGAIFGAPLITIGSMPLTLSIAGGVLVAGIVAGWLRSVHPTFGNIPPSVVWFMNVVGLNTFIGVIGIASGPSFVAGVQEVGMSLFLWGIVVTSVPVILALYIGKYIFRFDNALVLGCCAGACIATPALTMITDEAGSQVPVLGYTVTYAVSNTLLTVGGILIVMLLS